MRMLTASMLAAALTLAAAAAVADPSGSYEVQGTNPDGSVYEATVLVAKVGETFSITYTLSDATKIMGTAIGDDEVLAIGYGVEDNSGVALMFREGDNWTGVWTFLGSKAMGVEEWSPM